MTRATVVIAIATVVLTVGAGAHEAVGQSWDLVGNAGTDPSVNFIGTTDNQPLEILVNNQRAFRLEPNLAGNAPNVIGGSVSNAVIGLTVSATIAGGISNTVTASYGAVAGGTGNTAGAGAFVGGGTGNVASGGGAAILGGQSNTASGGSATVAGGAQNVASGLLSFAAGNRAKAMHTGSFVFADATGNDLTTAMDNVFLMRFSNGGAIFTNSGQTSGVMLIPGGNDWASVSDRAAKRDFTPVDGRAILARLAEIPIQSWSYRSEDSSIRHIGPMAQDFYAAFRLGFDDKHIGTVDEGGVALVAIQGLHQLLQERDTQIRAMEQRIDEMTARLGRLESLLSGLAR